MIRKGIRRLFTLELHRKSAWEREVEEEITLHLMLRAEQLASQGLEATTARDEAIRRFGPLNESRAHLLEAARHREEQMRRVEFIDDLKQDVTFALRTIRRQKAWTAVTVATLAIGIAATTAVWSAASTILLHPLSYPGASRIMMIYQRPTDAARSGIDITVSPQLSVVRAWLSGSRSFEALEPYAQINVTLNAEGNADGAELNAVRALSGFAQFAGERPLAGRGLSPSDIAERAPVVVLGEGFWRHRFSGDSTVVGRTLTINGVSRRVVGVMPASLKIPRVGATPADLWLPLDLSDPKSQRGVSLMGRLRPGATIDAARTELDSIAARTGAYGAAKAPFATVVISPGRRVGIRTPLLFLSAAVGLVLLVACANVMHLMLSQATARERELAVRSALGAARARLVRQLLTESILLTGVGTGLGIAGGYFGLKMLVALRPASLSALRDAHVDGYALSIIVAAAVASGLLFGLVSALNPWPRTPADTLKGSGPSTSGSGRSNRLRGALVVSEMAMSGLLLVGAVLLIRTVVNLQGTDLGFDPKHLYGVVLDLPNTRYPSPESKNVAIAQVEARLASTPGIKSVAVTNTLPGSRSFSIGVLEIDGEPTDPKATTAFIDVNATAPGYFRTIGARLIEGRLIQDTTTQSQEMIINAAFARRHWKDKSAVGHRMRVAFEPGKGAWLTIVGVVGDIAADGPTGEATAPVFFTARPESPYPGLVIRTDGNPAAIAAIEKAARTLQPSVPPTIESAESQVASSIAEPKFIMMLLGLFTGLALLLASMGLYGVMAYAVSQRTREIGIRMALGASAGAIAGSVFRRGALLASIGAVIGLTVATWGTRVIEGSLYGVERLDAASFVVGAVVLVGAAIVACVAPVRRAVRVNPITAIRAD